MEPKIFSKNFSSVKNVILPIRHYITIMNNDSLLHSPLSFSSSCLRILKFKSHKYIHNFPESARFTQSFAHFRAFASSFLDIPRPANANWLIVELHIYHRSAYGICNCRLLHYNLARLFSCRHIHLRRPREIQRYYTLYVGTVTHAFTTTGYFRKSRLLGVQQRNLQIIVKIESNLSTTRSNFWVAQLVQVI